MLIEIENWNFKVWPNIEANANIKKKLDVVYNISKTFKYILNVILSSNWWSTPNIHYQFRYYPEEIKISKKGQIYLLLAY